MPFELMGTSTGASRSFAILRKSGHRLFTASAGDKVDGYTIVSIDTRNVVLTAPDNSEQRLIAANEAAPVRAAGATALTSAGQGGSQLITQGLNTDQSAPANGSTAATAYDPNNGRQMGH